MDTVWDAFMETCPTVGIFLLILIVAYLVARELYRYFNSKMLSTPKSTIEKLKAISNMSFKEEGELRNKNDPVLVRRLVMDSEEAIDLYKSEGDSKKFQIQANVILQSYEGLKKGGRYIER
jgi:hypothetical protein